MAVVCVLNSFFWLHFNLHFFVSSFISLAIFLRISLTLICNFHLAKICLLANHDFCLRRFVRRCSIDYWAFKIIEPNGKPHRVTEPDNYYDCVLFLFFAFVLWLPTMFSTNSLRVYRIDDGQQNSLDAIALGQEKSCTILRNYLFKLTVKWLPTTNKKEKRSQQTTPTAKTSLSTLISSEWERHHNGRRAF